jgi:hypothetical protein
MDARADASPNHAKRALAFFRLAYTEVQYWLVGLSPEGYHAAQAAAWDELGNFNRVAKHLSAFLENTESAQMRAYLAYAYSRTGRWSDAAREYARVVTIWPDPSVILGLAEAKLELGDIESARALADTVEFGETPPTAAIKEAVDFFRAQLAEASRKSTDRARRD